MLLLKIFSNIIPYIFFCFKLFRQIFLFFILFLQFQQIPLQFQPLNLSGVQQYGDKLLFRGGINAQRWNDLEYVTAEIHEKVPIMKENGGFIFSSDHSIPSSVSLENMKHIVAAAKEAGKY